MPMLFTEKDGNTKIVIQGNHLVILETLVYKMYTFT